MLSSEIASEAM